MEESKYEMIKIKQKPNRLISLKKVSFSKSQKNFPEK